MSITKVLVGLNNNNLKTLERLVDKKDKRFKNKSAVIRTILECLEEDSQLGSTDGIIIIRKHSASVFSLNESGVTEDLLKDCTDVKITATKSSGSSVSRPDFKIEISYSDEHSL